MSVLTRNFIAASCLLAATACSTAPDQLSRLHYSTGTTGVYDTELSMLAHGGYNF